MAIAYQCKESDNKNCINTESSSLKKLSVQLITSSAKPLLNDETCLKAATMFKLTWTALLVLALCVIYQPGGSHAGKLCDRCSSNHSYYNVTVRYTDNSQRPHPVFYLGFFASGGSQHDICYKNRVHPITCADIVPVYGLGIFRTNVKCGISGQTWQQMQYNSTNCWKY